MDAGIPRVRSATLGCVVVINNGFFCVRWPRRLVNYRTAAASGRFTVLLLECLGRSACDQMKNQGQSLNHFAALANSR
jgi:hypothetical protein